MRTRPALVTPMPPYAGRGIPGLGHLIPFVRNPTAYLTGLRSRLGDTFLLDVAGFDLFCVFGPLGLRSLYALPEDEASFGQATRTLLGLKLPPELQAGDLAVFQHLAEHVRVPGKEMVSTFGHGRHACVGERFATSAMKIVITRLFGAFDLDPAFAHAEPPAGQMGAVGRAAAPCPVRYRRKVPA